jgi:ABC-type uncharacterized transport system substrate-binding protein
MRRRDFITVVLGAAGYSRSAGAREKAMPLIGFLSSRSSGVSASLVASFRQGLSEIGFVEGQNVTIEYRWSDGRDDRLPAMAADLVGRNVDIIATSGGPSSALSAKHATATIPIAFVIGTDPVEMGLVASLARPGGNLTGVSMLTTELNSKRVELLLELVPQPRIIALLVNPNYRGTEQIIREVQAATSTKGAELTILKAGTESEINAAFTRLVQEHAGALVVGNNSFFDSRVERFVALTAHYAVPAIYQGREFPEAGGLLSYGTSLNAVYRQLGTYAGKLLKGAKPADVPIEQPTKYELVINLKTAKALGLTVPQSLLARADEVIE